MRAPRSSRPWTRRRFLGAAAVTPVFGVLPRHLIAGSGQVPPSEQLNVAVIGTGGQGITLLKELLKHPDVNVTALCDVAEFWDNSHLYYRHHGGRGPARKAVEDDRAQAATPGRHPCAVHTDFRVMLERAGRDIDAVVVATPNHTHAIAALTALRTGKGVYCEKPLAHSVHEVRRLARAARETGLATQMGNQGHSSEDIRRAVEWIRAGAIGPVRAVHAWRGGSNRRIPRERSPERPPVPAGLEWDLWLGPAKERPFHPDYAPLMFHYWWDFGSGTLGNFGCHTLDTAVWALDLEHPTMIEASSSALNEETTPEVATYHYRFPARGDRPPVDLFWYDGGVRPPRPDFLEPEVELPAEGGSLIVGDRGAVLSGSWSGTPQLLSEGRANRDQLPAPSLPRSKGHLRDWIDACKGGPPASSNFEVAARLSEIVLLGKVALRTGRTVHWDGPAMAARNLPEAEPHVRGYSRKGWEV